MSDYNTKLKKWFLEKFVNKKQCYGLLDLYGNVALIRNKEEMESLIEVLDKLGIKNKGLINFCGDICIRFCENDYGNIRLIWDYKDIFKNGRCNIIDFVDELISFELSNIPMSEILTGEIFKNPYTSNNYKFNIGDEVWVKDNGYTYTTYKDWFKKNDNGCLLEYYTNFANPGNHSRCVVVARGGHEDFTDERLYAIRAESGNVYLIGEEGLEKAINTDCPYVFYIFGTAYDLAMKPLLNHKKFEDCFKGYRHSNGNIPVDREIALTLPKPNLVGIVKDNKKQIEEILKDKSFQEKIAIDFNNAIERNIRNDSNLGENLFNNMYGNNLKKIELGKNLLDSSKIVKLEKEEKEMIGLNSYIREGRTQRIDNNFKKLQNDIELIFVSEKKKQVGIKWVDGTTTYSNCSEEDHFDLEVGLFIAIQRKFFASKSKTYKWLKNSGKFKGNAKLLEFPREEKVEEIAKATLVKTCKSKSATTKDKKQTVDILNKEEIK